MRRILMVLPVLALALGATAACGGEATDEPGRDSAEQAETDLQQRSRDYAACMREQGVEMDDPDLSDGGSGLAMSAGDGVNLDAAMEACRDLSPFDDLAEEPTPAELERERRFAQCMREHGVDLPDPSPDGSYEVEHVDGDGTTAGSVGVDPDDPVHAAALEACESILQEHDQ